MHSTVRTLLSFVVCGSMVVTSASPAIIGVARADGEFRLNNALVTGNGTVTEGVSIEAVSGRSEVLLRTGGRVLLTSSSRGKVYGNHLVLEHGAAQLRNQSGYAVQANGLQIATTGSRALIQVALNTGNQVHVDAIAGTAEVRNAKGLLVAHMAAGKAMDFTPVGDASETKLTGVVEKRNDRFFVTDQTTTVTTELKGAGLDRFVGKRTLIAAVVKTDAQPAFGAELVGEVNAAEPVTDSSAAAPNGNSGDGAAGSSGAGSAGSAAGTATAGTAGGISTATVAVVAGVAATAGVVGGLYGTGAIGHGHHNSASR